MPHSAQGLLRPLCDVGPLPSAGIRTSVVCWLSNQSVGSPVPRQKRRAGYGVPWLQSPPAPVGQALGGTGAVVFLASCVWGLEGWVVGVGTSADLVNAL